jgi:hypothetical protein
MKLVEFEQTSSQLFVKNDTPAWSRYCAEFMTKNGTPDALPKLQPIRSFTNGSVQDCGAFHCQLREDKGMQTIATGATSQELTTVIISKHSLFAS